MLSLWIATNNYNIQHLTFLAVHDTRLAAQCAIVFHFLPCVTRSGAGVTVFVLLLGIAFPYSCVPAFCIAFHGYLSRNQLCEGISCFPLASSDAYAYGGKSCRYWIRPKAAHHQRSFLSKAWVAYSQIAHRCQPCKHAFASTIGASDLSLTRML